MRISSSCCNGICFIFQLGDGTTIDKNILTDMTGPLSANVKVYAFLFLCFVLKFIIFSS